MLGYFNCGSAEVDTEFFDYIAVREDGKVFTNLFMQDMYEVGEEIEPVYSQGWREL